MLVDHIHQLIHVGRHIGGVVVVGPAPHAVGRNPGHGEEAHILHIQLLARAVAEDGLLGKPGQVANRELSGHVLKEDLGNAGDGAHLCDLLEALLNGRLEEGLLGLDTAQVAVGVARVEDVAVVVAVVTPAQQLHGLVAVDKLIALLEVNLEVLGQVVVVHPAGDVKVHAADGVHQLAHGLPLHHKGVVRDEAHQLADLLLQGVHALVAAAVHVVDGVDLLNVPGDVDQGVPGNAHDGQLLVGDIIGGQHHSVRIAAAVCVAAHHQEGIEILLPVAGHAARPRTCSAGFALLLRTGRLLGAPVRLCYLGRLLDEDGQGNSNDHNDSRQNGDADKYAAEHLLLGGALRLGLFGLLGLAGLRIPVCKLRFLGGDRLFLLLRRGFRLFGGRL